MRAGALLFALLLPAVAAAEPEEPWTTGQKVAVYLAGPVAAYVGTAGGVLLGADLEDRCGDAACGPDLHGPVGSGILGMLLVPVLAVALVGSVVDADGSGLGAVLGVVLGTVTGVIVAAATAGYGILLLPGFAGLGASIGWASAAPKPPPTTGAIPSVGLTVWTF